MSIWNRAFGIESDEDNNEEQNISETDTLVATINGQELGTLQRIDYLTAGSLSLESGDSSASSFYVNSTGDISLTGTIGTGTLQLGEISNSQFARLSSPTERMAEYMEDYLRNRNAENPIFINYNTSQRPIEYNDIADVIQFREYLDSKIKEYYQRG